ncbi:hypothetical protein RHMOL_Rhmol09G0085400 [Rhododendron molle]|uniref:Uncharacterized protein n=1 Tax=Rhododendron molle TaxID=49168 RepID=A0ACC0MBU6_RHOML|nr:hypothetical protein RHMOL_Rhmol09G0085400 [Rhododendron molle]
MKIEPAFDKLNHRKKKGPYSSLFFKEARKMLDIGAKLGIEVKGGRNYKLKRFVKMQEEELRERIHALDDYEEESISGDDDDLEDDISAAPIEDQSKQENNATAPLVTASSRWNPTPEQLRALEDMYEGGTRTPTADQIKLIAGMLRRFGKIEGKNVFYWFQNHKARERQKRRRDHRGSTLQTEEPGFEVGQAKNNATSNCSTNSEDSASIHRAVEASESRAQGWIRLEERELLQQRRTRTRTTTQSKHATWRLMEPSPTPQAFQFKATTTSTAPGEALNLSMNLAPNTISFEEDQGGNPPTLELFPIRTRDWSAEKGDYEASMASIDTSFVPHQFFEFLPMRN